MKRAGCALVLALLTACAAKPPAPVVERSGQQPQAEPVPAGYFRVSHGDTLYAIAFSQGLDYRQLARWNGLRPPYVIYPGQELRLTAPPGSTAPERQSTAATQPQATAQGTPPVPVSKRSGAPASTNAQAGSKPPPKQKAAPMVQGEPESWLWPVGGRVVRGYLPNDPARNGLDIAGSEGEAVKATADGTVVYSGNGLIGYGELIIVKHSERLLSAYAHNRKRLVAEGEPIQAGQKIAELGRNDRSEQILHFEIRVNGKPVDPMQYLPRR